MTEYDASTDMTNESRQEEQQEEKEAQLTEEEQRRWKELEEEEGRKDVELRQEHKESPATEDMGQSKPESNTWESKQQQLDAVIREVKQEFREWKLVKRGDLVRKLGHAYENVVSDPKDVCEEVKNTLRDEIDERLISTRDIERYCLGKWKKKTKPNAGAKTENDKLSFSEQQHIAEPQKKRKQEVAVQVSGLETVVEPKQSATNTNTSEPSSTTASPISPESIDIHSTGEDSMFPWSRDKSTVCKNCLIKDNWIKKLEDENRELSVRCSLEESSNNELVLQLTAREKEFERFLEEEHDLSDLPDQYVRQECLSCRELKEKVIELSEALKHTPIRRPDEIPASEDILSMNDYWLQQCPIPLWTSPLQVKNGYRRL